MTNLLRHLRTNPRLASRKVWGRVARALGVRRRTVNGVRFPFPAGGGAMVELMRTYSYENELLLCMLDWLRPGDTFIDVGANIGFVSAYALSLVGETGRVHAFEPVPEYHDNLHRLADWNPHLPICPHLMGISNCEGEVDIAVSADGNIGWNTMVPDFMPASMIGSRHRVRVDTLDHVLGSVDARMVKIDVEGYEFNVLDGMHELVERTRPVVFLEYAPAGNTRLGVGANDFAAWANRHRYSVRDPASGGVVRFEDLSGTQNLLLVPAAGSLPEL